MNLIITKAKKRYLNECEKALIDSNLGRNYFSSKDSGKRALNEGLKTLTTSGLSRWWNSGLTTRHS